MYDLQYQDSEPISNNFAEDPETSRFYANALGDPVHEPAAETRQANTQ